MKTIERSSGILFHPTSLPGKYGIGTLGKEAYKFIDFLVESRQKLWQILPLGPTGYGDSPYQCFSSMAGNPLLIDLEILQDEGWLDKKELPDNIRFTESKVDYGKIIKVKYPLLRKAFGRFMKKADSVDVAKYEAFCKKHTKWLDDYALFMALKNHYGLKPWHDWSFEVVVRQESEIEKFRNELEEEIQFHKFMQYMFFKQWLELKAYAAQNYIKIIGDIPIYVAYDSIDAWINPEIFLLDEKRKPLMVAGVPPDYFSKTGQLWGNPIYNWDRLKLDGYQWWIERLKANLVLYDIIRIDHFRGLESFWAVPYGEKTAVKGEWVTGPGHDFFDTIFEALPNIKIIAEDLGVITPEVEELRDAYGMPGMKILQFAFDSKEDNEYLPHTYDKNCVVYTGTHDNDTIKGWYKSLGKDDNKKMQDYLDTDNKNVEWKMIRAAWASVAQMALVPMQDILELGTDARMNMPGNPAGNWQWRMKKDALTPEIAKKLAHLTQLYGR